MYIKYIYYIYKLYTNTKIMNKLKKLRNWEIILQNWESSINILHISWKIHLTKKDISNLFSVKKSEIKVIIELLDIDYINYTNKETNKVSKIYSLDDIILIWYKLKKFNETKILIKTNRILKNTQKNTFLKILKWKYNKILEKINTNIELAI